MTYSDTPRWWYDFSPDSNTVRAEVESFHSPDIRIWAEASEGVPNWFSWSSYHLDDVSDAQELADRTAALKAIFDGAMLLVYGFEYTPLRFNFKPSGQPLPPGELTAPDVRVEPFSSAYLSHKINDTDGLRSAVVTLIFLARYDEVAKQLLKFLGVQGMTYVSLYALTDWMKKPWGSDRIAREAGLSATRLNDFTQTANNPAYLGPFCRHGGVSAPPKRPMPLTEAEGPIRRAAIAFLDERAAALPLSAKWNLIKR